MIEPPSATTLDRAETPPLNRRVHPASRSHPPASIMSHAVRTSSLARLPGRLLRATLLIGLVAWTQGQVDDASASMTSARPTTRADKTDLAAIEKQAIQAIDRVAEATVLVTFRGRAGSSASGVIINSKGLILTAGHVGDQAGRRGVITLPDGRDFRGITLGQIRWLEL